MSKDYLAYKRYYRKVVCIFYKKSVIFILCRLKCRYVFEEYKIYLR